MRVLMVSDVFFPRVNGVSTSIATFRRELAAQGVTIDLIAPAYPGHTEMPGIYRVPSRYLAFDPEDRLMKRGAIRGLLPCLRSQQYDLLHIQTPFAAHYAGLELARTLQLKTVTTYHTFFEEYLHHYARVVPANWTRALARRFSRSQCNATDGVIAPSTAMRDALLAYGVTAPIAVIPTGIPLDHFRPGDGRQFRASLGLTDAHEVGLFVGRVAHEKNIDLLLDMTRHLKQTRPRFVLVIAGEGPALGHLQSRVEQLGLQEQVRFVGYLDRQQGLLNCYSAADVFVFASTTETQGLVLLEAMALGLPVVAVPAMGAKDILGPAKGCVPVQANAEDFAVAVATLLADPAQLQRLQAQAREYAQSWSAPATAERMAAFYRQVIQGSAEQPAVGHALAKAAEISST